MKVAMERILRKISDDMRIKNIFAQPTFFYDEYFGEHFNKKIKEKITITLEKKLSRKEMEELAAKEVKRNGKMNTSG